VRRYLVLATVCFIFFILPLQVFIIGDYTGIGIQGAVYRFQTSGYGTYFFPITREIIFVLNGTLTGKTALSVLLWAMGSVVLTITTLYSFLQVRDTAEKYFRYIAYGLVASCIAFLGSCIAQYGFFFQGPAGISLPAGIVAILFWIAVLHYYNHFVASTDKE
jgi:hypothetical protein